jgi:predicted DNA-binding transcriptional regulator AlpA
MSQKNLAEEYLTVEELSKRIRFSKQTLYNMISSRKFIKGQHYLKPSRKKVLFLWSGIQTWLEDQNSHDNNQHEPATEENLTHLVTNLTKSLIKI